MKSFLEQIDLRLPPSERIKKYLELVGDPYIIVVDGKKTKVSFAGKKPIKQNFSNYFIERHLVG